MIRQPIIVVLGHVDHGKTTLLDYIRGTSIAAKEAGGITQHIGATEIPQSALRDMFGDKLEKMGVKLTIPGLLFIDTPGHEAFTNLRKRGGSIADLAVLVIDINQGFQPQTIEAMDILKTYKVPFVVAANKIDMIDGWKPHPDSFFLSTFGKQEERVKTTLENKVYELVGKLYEMGFEAERFDRVQDFTKQILIIPISAKTGEGVPDLILYLAGLSQKYMEKNLETDVTKPGRGAILEVKEVQGLGTTIDIILYEGKISAGDTIVLPGVDGPIKTKVRALLKPKPLSEIRDPKQKFNSVKEVTAASGVKIAAPGLDKAIPGGTVIVVHNDETEAIEEIKQELSETEFTTDKDGVVVKADTLGSLEAIKKMLKEKNIPVKSGGIGKVTKRDVAEAFAVKQNNNYLGVILAFNTEATDEAKVEANKLEIPIFSNKVIYKILEDYEEWVNKEKEREKENLLQSKLYPAEIRILPGYVFRRSKPAIVGIEVVSGIIRPGVSLINTGGHVVGKLKGLQDKGESISEAKEGMQVAASIDGPTVGRQINEGDTLYTHIPMNRIRVLIPALEKEGMMKEVELLKKIWSIEKAKGVI